MLGLIQDLANKWEDVDESVGVKGIGDDGLEVKVFVQYWPVASNRQGAKPGAKVAQGGAFSGGKFLLVWEGRVDVSIRLLLDA